MSFVLIVVSYLTVVSAVLVGKDRNLLITILIITFILFFGKVVRSFLLLIERGLWPQVDRGFPHRHVLVSRSLHCPVMMINMTAPHRILCSATHAFLHNISSLNLDGINDWWLVLSKGNFIFLMFSTLIVVKRNASLSEWFCKIACWGLFNFLFTTEAQGWASSNLVLPVSFSS